MTSTWRNRIVGHDVKPAYWFLANPDNWRIHPVVQQKDMLEIMRKIGWIDEPIVNLRTSEHWPMGDRNIETLIDGHLRVSLALDEGDDTPVPYETVDLEPAEEALALILFDPIGRLAVTDTEQLGRLLRAQAKSQPDMADMLQRLADANGIMLQRLADQAGQMTEVPSAVPVKMVTCPHCQQMFSLSTQA